MLFLLYGLKLGSNQHLFVRPT